MEIAVPLQFLQLMQMQTLLVPGYVQFHQIRPCLVGRHLFLLKELSC